MEMTTIFAPSQKGTLLAASLFFGLFMFFMPISPTLKSIFFACSIISILLTPQCNSLLFRSYYNVWGMSALALFGMVFVACFWSPAPLEMQWSVLEKYSKLLYLPILALGLSHTKFRYWGINAYLASMCLTCVISIFNAHFLGSQDPGAVFYNHIVTGFMMAVAAYLSGVFVFLNSGWKKALYALNMGLASYQILFINTGRTGYVIYGVLMILLILQKLPLLKAVLGVALFSTLFIGAYQSSTIMQTRVSDLLSDIHFLKQDNQNTSLGYRIQFHHYAKSLWIKHPLVGIGTGGFKYRFAQDKPVPAWGGELTDPHSQYWMTLTEQGVIGALILVAFMVSLLVMCSKLQTMRPVLLGMLTAFCIGSVSDTILCYSTAGYLLIALSALCFGELIEHRAQEYRH